MRFRSSVLLLLALAVLAGALYLRFRPRPQKDVVESEKGVVLPPTLGPGPVPSPPSIAPPQLAEVRPVLDRVFEQTLTLDQATQPAFVAGDFNGDDATDLAVAVRPRGAEELAKLNEPLSSWAVQDATAPHPETVRRPEPVSLAATDLLLAVVHGVDPGGWRNPDAVQGYLLKNAAGRGLQVRPLAGVPGAIRAQVIRTHVGDVMATERGGERGVVFWTGATYAWASVTPRSPVTKR